MGAFLSAIFLVSVLAMFVVYPMYFMALNDFKNTLIEHAKPAWDELPTGNDQPPLGRAYRALRLSRDGKIGDTVLCDEVMTARRTAVRLLYTGMCCFMLVLSIGLLGAIQR